MESLPKLPGLTFNDPTLDKYHLSQTFQLCNGYKLPKNSYAGIGQRQLDTSSVKYISKCDTVPFDPALTYGRIKTLPGPKFLPPYVLYSQKCLAFKAFFKELTKGSPLETYRIRHANIIYFLEDDSLTVIEPKIPNSGLYQGRLIRRGKIPKNDAGDCWHWKDLAVGRDYQFFGIVFHTVDCDAFTREYLASQGLVMAEPEIPPPDPYLERRGSLQDKGGTSKSPRKSKRFSAVNGEILTFFALWDTDTKRKFEIYYFLSDGTVMVKEDFGKSSGEFAQLLKRTKLIKNWDERPVGNFPSEDAQVAEYCDVEDFKVGGYVSVLGRQMLIYDCDPFTRHFYRNVLQMEQKAPIEIEKKTPESKVKEKKTPPPHDGIGSLEDSLQNTLTFLPKPPKKDVVKQILHANKYLRYELKIDSAHPEDQSRRFLLFYSLGDSTCRIFEPHVRNSGRITGKYLRSLPLPKPNTDPLNPEYYSPVDFTIGATIVVFQQKFIITGADLHVFNYMKTNPEKFPCAVIENIRSYMDQNGLLEQKISENEEKERIREERAIKMRLECKQNDIESALEKMNLDIIVPKNQLLDCKYILPEVPTETSNEELHKQKNDVKTVKFADCEC